MSELVEKLEVLRELLQAVLPETMGGYPDLFGPDEGWEEWEEKAKQAISIPTSPPGDGGLRGRLAAAERQEMSGFGVSVEELLDESLLHELAIDNTSNVQGAFARICSLLQEKSTALGARKEGGG